MASCRELESQEQGRAVSVKTWGYSFQRELWASRSQHACRLRAFSLLDGPGLTQLQPSLWENIRSEQQEQKQNKTG